MSPASSLPAPRARQGGLAVSAFAPGSQVHEEASGLERSLRSWRKAPRDATGMTSPPGRRVSARWAPRRPPARGGRVSRALVAAAGPRRPPGAWLGLARSDTRGLSQILSLSPCAEFDSRHRPAQARPAAWPHSCDSGRLPGLRALSPRRWPGAAEEPFSFPRVFSLVCSGGLWLGPGLHAARTLLGGRHVRAQPAAAAQAPPRRPPQRVPRSGRPGLSGLAWPFLSHGLCSSCSLGFGPASFPPVSFG